MESGIIPINPTIIRVMRVLRIARGESGVIPEYMATVRRHNGGEKKNAHNFVLSSLFIEFR